LQILYKYIKNFEAILFSFVRQLYSIFNSRYRHLYLSAHSLLILCQEWWWYWNCHWYLL